MMSEHGLSERQACKLLDVDRSSYRYEPLPDRNAELRQELIECHGLPIWRPRGRPKC